jgi:hypothetical protein
MSGVNVITPADIERESREGKKPKPAVQSTEKILLQELTELGLEDWMNKDRSTTEYKKTVAKARARRREWNKLQTLAKHGIKVPQAMQKVQSGSTTYPLPAASISVPESDEKVPQACAQLSADVSGGPVKQPAESERPVTTGVATRRRQRLEAIRRRDQLAQAAMEMDD